MGKTKVAKVVEPFAQTKRYWKRKTKKYKKKVKGTIVGLEYAIEHTIFPNKDNRDQCVFDLIEKIAVIADEGNDLEISISERIKNIDNTLMDLRSGNVMLSGKKRSSSEEELEDIKKSLIHDIIKVHHTVFYGYDSIVHMIKNISPEFITKSKFSVDLKTDGSKLSITYNKEHAPEKYLEVYAHKTDDTKPDPTKERKEPTPDPVEVPPEVKEVKETPKPAPDPAENVKPEDKKLKPFTIEKNSYTADELKFMNSIKWIGHVGNRNNYYTIHVNDFDYVASCVTTPPRQTILSIKNMFSNMTVHEFTVEQLKDMVPHVGNLTTNAWMKMLVSLMNGKNS